MLYYIEKLSKTEYSGVVFEQFCIIYHGGQPPSCGKSRHFFSCIKPFFLTTLFYCTTRVMPPATSSEFPHKSTLDMSLPELMLPNNKIFL